MTITLARYEQYRAAWDRRIAEAHRLRRERLERHTIPPTACAIDEDAEAELDRLVPAPSHEDEVNARRAEATREGVRAHKSGASINDRLAAYCRAHARPDKSVDRAALYAAFGAHTRAARRRLSTAIGKLQRAGRLPWRIDPLDGAAAARAAVPLVYRVLAWCEAHARPDGSVDRAALYAAFGGDDPAVRARLADLIYDLRVADRLPYRIDRLRRGECLRRAK